MKMSSEDKGQAVKYKENTYTETLPLQEMLILQFTESILTY